MPNVGGLWLGLMLTGLESAKPTAYFTEADFQFFYATDTGALYIAPKPATVAGVVAAPVWGLAAGNPQQFSLFEDFYGLWVKSELPNSARFSSTAGAGTGNAAAVTVAGSLNGEVTIKSASDDGTDAQNMSLLTSINTSFKASSGGLSMTARVKIDDITHSYLFVGFTDTISTTVEAPIFMNAAVIDSDATNACGIMFDVDATVKTFTLGGVKADVDTDPLVSALVPVAATYVTLRVDVDTAGTVTGYVNGVSIGSVANATTVSTGMTPCIAVGNRSANQIVATVDWITAKQNRV